MLTCRPARLCEHEHPTPLLPRKNLTNVFARSTSIVGLVIMLYLRDQVGTFREGMNRGEQRLG